MDGINADISAVSQSETRPQRSVSEKRPSRAARTEAATSRAGSAAISTAKTRSGEQLILALREPKPPPEVEKIRKAVVSSYEQKRALLAVLSSPAPKENRAVDLHA